MDNLLIVLHSVDYDHPRNRFICKWLEEFAKYHKTVHVICQVVGNTQGIPENVVLHSLEKGKGGLIHQIIRYWKTLWNLRGQYELIFIHNYANWLNLGFPFFVGTPTFFWHCHHIREIKNYFAAKLCTKLFTHSYHSFPYPQPRKAVYFGHGIDTKIFKPMDVEENSEFTILTTGRFGPEKRYDLVVQAVERFNREADPPTKLVIITSVSTAKDRDQLDSFKKKIRRTGCEVELKVNVPNKNMPLEMNDADLFINLGHIGSYDKVVLESMACGTPVLTMNSTFLKYLEGYEYLIVEDGSVTDLVQKIKHIAGLSDSERENLRQYLVSLVQKEHDYRKLIQDFELAFEKYS